jgi:hypothetical protein
MRPDYVAFGSNSKELGLDRVDVSAEFTRKDFIEGFDETLAWGVAVCGSILGSIRDPQIGDAGRAKSAAHGSAYFPRAFGVFDPEFSDGFVFMRKR